jgi:hypothetical protein
LVTWRQGRIELLFGIFIALLLSILGTFLISRLPVLAVDGLAFFFCSG